MPFYGQAAFAAERSFMEFFNSAIGVLQTLVIALGAGLGIWGVINLLEGYGNDNPGAKSQGIKQLMAGGGVALIGTILVPLLITHGFLKIYRVQHLYPIPAAL